MRPLLLLLLVGSFLSCSKETQPTQTFYYHDFVPDTVFPMPVEDDVTFRFDLQIGPDTSSSIKITLRTASTYSAHMPETDYWLWFAAHDSTLRFIDQENYPNGPCNPPLIQGDTITPLDLMTPTYLVFLQNWNWPEAPLGCSSFEWGGYIGFRFFRGGHYFMGWMNAKVNPDLSFSVDEYYYSLIPDTPVQVGIKE